MPAPPLDDGNGRVTLAVLSSKLDALSYKVEKLCDSVDRRIGFVEEKQEIGRGELESQIHVNSKDIARLEERQRATTSILGAFTLIASSVAGIVGSVFK